VSATVIDAATLAVTTVPISVGFETHIFFPWGVAVSPDGKSAYIAVVFGPPGVAGLEVIDTATNTVKPSLGGSPGLVPAGGQQGVAVSPDGNRIYLTNGDAVTVIDTTGSVTATIPVGTTPIGVAVTPDSRRVYVANQGSNNISVIDAATDAVVATIPVGNSPLGVAVTPDGRKVFVTNSGSNTVSVISTAKDKVTATVHVGKSPTSFGVFIQPARRFAGLPGKASCFGRSVAALARQFGGLNAAAAGLGLPSVGALQEAIQEFCEA
jgi:YVTN family beta-propeller protein